MLVQLNEKNYTFKLKEFKFKSNRCTIQAMRKKEREIEQLLLQFAKKKIQCPNFIDSL